jgi:hypothetical protein
VIEVQNLHAASVTSCTVIRTFLEYVNWEVLMPGLLRGLAVNSTVLLLLIVSSGCAFGAYQTWANFRSHNRTALGSIRIGMTPEQVKEIMGTAAVTGCTLVQGALCLATETMTNPAYTSAITGIDGKSYMAWMYYTSKCDSNQPQLACHTPIVFHDGVVVGWGTEYLSATKLDVKIH